jgi:hypothetical protein
MPPAVLSVGTYQHLTEFIHKTLCEQDELDPQQSHLQHVVIERRGRPCGLLFDVTGPRLLRTSAIWAAEEDRILFYNSAGQRMAEVTLTESPDLSNCLSAS